ncbi:hypothetical protein FR965_28250 [Serratia marcescens]|nr:hypothetical protein FR965_28250 [Serratia marcescens]
MRSIGWPSRCESKTHTAKRVQINARTNGSGCIGRDIMIVTRSLTANEPDLLIGNEAVAYSGPT